MKTNVTVKNVTTKINARMQDILMKIVMNKTSTGNTKYNFKFYF